MREAMKNFAFTVASVSALFLLGCMPAKDIPVESGKRAPVVSSLELSKTMGHVGKPFAARISYQATGLVSPEYRVDSLPPGLKFDPEKVRIVGIPKADGFFAVTIAVRKKRKPGLHFDTVDGAWHSERFEISIYKPVKDDEDDAGGWDDDPVAAMDSF
jgi:hypothetical protein